MMEIADLTAAFLALVGILYFPIIGVVLWRRGFRERTVGLLLFYALVSSIWTLGQALHLSGLLASPADDILARVLLYGVLVLSMLFLQLNRSFLRLEGTGWIWWALGVAWLAVAIVLNENLLGLPEVLLAGDGWRVRRQGLGFGVSVLGWGIFMGGATLLTALAYRRTRQPLHRNRITYWPLALGFTIVGAALFFVEQEALGSGLHLLGTLSAAYVTLTYRLPDVRQAARRTVSYSVVTLLAVFIYTVGFLVAQYVFQSVPGYGALLAGISMALGMVILFHPPLGLVQRLTDRLFSGISYDASHTLREYSMSISNILDLERLATVVVGLISEAMEIRRGALFVVHYEAGNGHFLLRGVVGMGEDLTTGVLSTQGPVADYLLRERGPLTQYDVDILPRFRDALPEERAWLASLDMDVYVPIFTKGDWIGLLALGPKVSGDRYFDDDLLLLSTLADQTAVALENARLFDDLRRLNAELVAANRELAQLDQAKSSFIDIASHELRTPLAQVSGYNELVSEMIEDGSLTPETWLPLIQDINRSVGRLKEVVNVMLDVSQLDDAALALDVLPTSLDLIVRAAADVWGRALQERRLSLTIEGLEGLPLITADGNRLRQVFSQLIQNAIKSTPDGGQVRITGRLLGREMPLYERNVEVVVSDTGIGIPLEDLDRIFDKFYRVGDVMSHSTGEIKFKGAGPGLGLTIARGIVEAHGGHIWAESPGYDEKSCPGSEFHVILPVQSRLHHQKRNEEV